jgi:hypothetical protein
VSAGPISTPWRSFLRFSLRGLIVFVIGVGAGLGWIVRQAHVQRDAVAAIEEVDGSVRYDWEFRRFVTGRSCFLVRKQNVMDSAQNLASD